MSGIRGGDTPPVPSSIASGTGGRGRHPTREKTEPVQGTRLRDVHGHKAPSGMSVGVIINW